MRLTITGWFCLAAASGEAGVYRLEAKRHVHEGSASLPCRLAQSGKLKNPAGLSPPTKCSRTHHPSGLVEKTLKCVGGFGKLQDFAVGSVLQVLRDVSEKVKGKYGERPS
jgi:hypothetical protein